MFYYVSSLIGPTAGTSLQRLRCRPGGGGTDCHIWAIEVCAAVKGMVFTQFTLA